MATKNQRAVRTRIATGEQMNTLYTRKAGAHADRRTKRERTRAAVLNAAMRDYR